MTTEQQPRPYPFSEPDRLELDPAYAQIRAEGGLARVQCPYGTPALLATRYEDVKLVLGDPRFSRARAVAGDQPAHTPIGPGPDAMVSMDPPDHTRLRRVVAKAFTMRRIEQLRPRVQQIIEDLLDAMQAQGRPVDLVAEFARPQPALVIFELFGVPGQDRKKLQEWAETTLTATGDRYTLQDVFQALDSLRAYMADLLEERRRKPADDLLSVLVAARDEEERLSEKELLDLATGVLITGYETTADQISNFAYLLLTRPDHLRQLRADPELIPQAVEEMLRFVPLLRGTSFPRVATEDVLLSGGLVRAGEAVLPAMMSANRDEAVFTDPDELDFHREHNPHLGFGHGVHRCLGAQLAKMELQIALGALLRRFPQLRLAVPAKEVPWRVVTLQRAPRELLVTW
ncbi:cytochrome P450 [Streptomyces sp. CO7]